MDPQVTRFKKYINQLFKKGSVSKPVASRAEIEKLKGKIATNLFKSATEARKTNGEDLVEKANKHKFDPIIGRDEEIQRIVNILSRSTKNNPLIIGEYGVGKTAIVKGLAQRIARGDVPSNLANACLIDLDLCAIAIEAGNRREMEERIEAMMNEDQKANGKVILFVDEIHIAPDALHLWKHVLARGQLKCIGTTLPRAYKKYVEKDASIETMFEQVHVTEPSVSDTIKILGAMKKKYEANHRVRIQDRALEVAAQLSAQYITNHCLPIKAINVVGYACGYVKDFPIEYWPPEIVKLDKKMIELEGRVYALKKEKDKASKARLAEVKQELHDLKDKLEPYKRKSKTEKLRNDEFKKHERERERLLLEIKHEEARSYFTGIVDSKHASLVAQLEYVSEQQMMVAPTVGPKHISIAVSYRTGIPVIQLGQNVDKDRPVGQ